MKNLLIVLMLLISCSVFSQIEALPSFIIENDTKEYGKIVYSPTLIYDKGAGALWLVEEKVGPDKTLETTFAKIQLSGVSGGIPEAPIDGKQYARQDGTWTEVIIYTPTTTIDFATFVPQDSFPTAEEGRMCVLNGTEGKMLYMYSDGIWVRFMPLNKSINGVTFTVPDGNMN